jgi:serine/threonine protein phosphatase PrpC
MMSNEKAVACVCESLQSGASPLTAATALVNACLSKDPWATQRRGCDNITAVVVCFKVSDTNSYALSNALI